MKGFRMILEAACHRRDHGWALATLVKTEGSSYRRPGARVLVSPEGTTLGVVSGGCLEEEIARQGLEVMEGGRPRLIDFDTRRLFGCDGRLWIHLEPIPPAGTTGNFLTEVAERISRRAICRARVPYLEGGSSEILRETALVVEKDGVFVETIALPTRLLVFGEGPEVAPIRGLARELGWIVAAHAHPDELAEDFVPDGATAAVVMTHKFGRDLAALDRLLPLGLPYIGLLGPRRRHAELVRRLGEFREPDPSWLEALHAPAGLDIGSETPEEIAFSILSEVSAVLAKRRGGFLREKPGTIHRLEARA